MVHDFHIFLMHSTQFNTKKNVKDRERTSGALVVH